MKQYSSNTRKYMKYSGMGFQIIAALLIGMWIGGKLDTYWQNQTPYATLAMMFLMLGSTMYQVIAELSRESEKENKPRK